MKTPEQRTTIANCLFWLFFGLLFTSDLVIMLYNAISGDGFDDIRIGGLFVGVVGISMLFRGIKGFQEIRDSNPLPKSVVWFIWIIIGIPTALSLWGIIFAFFNFSIYWSSLINIIPFALGVMSIASVYENKSDAFSLIQIFITVQAIAIVSFLVNLMIGTIPVNIKLIIFKLFFVVAGFLHIYLSKELQTAMPLENRTKSRVSIWLLFIFLGICVLVNALCYFGII